MAGVLLLAAGGLVGIGCFMPWSAISANAVGLSLQAHVQGTDTTSGKIALALAAVSVFAATAELFGQTGAYTKWAVGTAVAGALVVAEKCWRLYGDVAVGAQNSPGASATVGHGLWVALLGGVLALAAGKVARADAA